MAEASSELEGPNFQSGCEIDKLADEEMLLGHAFGEPVLVARARWFRRPRKSARHRTGG